MEDNYIKGIIDCIATNQNAIKDLHVMNAANVADIARLKKSLTRHKIICAGIGIYLIAVSIKHEQDLESKKNKYEE